MKNINQRLDKICDLPRPSKSDVRDIIKRIYKEGYKDGQKDYEKKISKKVLSNN